MTGGAHYSTAMRALDSCILACIRGTGQKRQACSRRRLSRVLASTCGTRPLKGAFATKKGRSPQKRGIPHKKGAFPNHILIPSATVSIPAHFASGWQARGSKPPLSAASVSAPDRQQTGHKLPRIPPSDPPIRFPVARPRETGCRKTQKSRCVRLNYHPPRNRLTGPNPAGDNRPQAVTFAYL